ncbi:MAG: hypothetical protein CMD68_01455 [Gammaproteobacteria bacterium]|nr:hypothetical protein [Gammaproteobacteria bacterium]
MLFAGSINTFALDEYSSEDYQDYVRGCNNPKYPMLKNDVNTDTINAGIIDIQSNGDISLSEDVFIALDKGRVKANSATYLQNQNTIKNINNGSIYYANNYFNFLNGSLNKKSEIVELINGSTYLRERNLLINYGSLSGNLGKTLEFKNASLSSCRNNDDGWNIEAEIINIDQIKKRGHIKNFRLEIFNKTIIKFPHIPFPATTKRLSGFLEPELNFTSDGLDLFLPYFYVISKKSDITVAPRIINDRGTGLETNLRYLSNVNHDSPNFFDVLFLPKDKKLKKNFIKNNYDRWAFRLKEDRSFSIFKTSINWGKSSDPLVFLDLPSSITNIANQRDHYLPQTVSIRMILKNFSMNILREGYQSLNPFMNSSFIKKPEVSLNYINYGSIFSYFLKADYVNFDTDKNKDLFFYTNKNIKLGKRLTSKIGAEIQYSLKNMDISIKATMLHKKYNLSQTDQREKLTSIPSFKIKISSLFGKISGESASFITPEIEYARTNYKDQSKDPIFDLHQRSFSNLNLNNGYFYGKDRIPDTEFFIGKLKWLKKIDKSKRLNIQLIKKNELKPSKVLNAMLVNPIDGDNQAGFNLAFETPNIDAYLEANYSQKRNTLNFGKTGLQITIPKTKLSISRNFLRNIPVLDSNNKINFAELSLERTMTRGFKLISGISKDLNSKKNLETYFGFGYENCCLAFKLYASDKRFSKYNLLNFQTTQFYNNDWERMISVENKSRINFDFELKGLTGGNKRLNRFFSNNFLNL